MWLVQFNMWIKVKSFIFYIFGLDFAYQYGFIIKSRKMTAILILTLQYLGLCGTIYLIYLTFVKVQLFFEIALITHQIEVLVPVFIQFYIQLKSFTNRKLQQELKDNLNKIDVNLTTLYNKKKLKQRNFLVAKHLVFHVLFLLAVKFLMMFWTMEFVYYSSFMMTVLVFSVQDLHFKYHVDTLTQRITELNDFLSSIKDIDLQTLENVQRITMQIHKFHTKVNWQFSTSLFMTISFNFFEIILTLYWLFMRFNLNHFENLIGKMN